MYIIRLRDINYGLTDNASKKKDKKKKNFTICLCLIVHPA